MSRVRESADRPAFVMITHYTDKEGDRPAGRVGDGGPERLGIERFSCDPRQAYLRLRFGKKFHSSRGYG